MSRKKKGHEKEPNLERWLVSYADFITLLFAVFVTLYAMSIVDKAKVEEVKASMQSAFGVVPGSPPMVNFVDSLPMPLPTEALEDLARMELPSGQAEFAESEDFTRIKEEIQAQLEQNGSQGDVKLEVNERGLVISLKEAGFFTSGNASVQPESQPIFDRIAASISGYANALRVEGHTDNIPMASPVYPSNWELSTARATSIVRLLVERHGFSGAKLSATGYGEFRPVGDNSNEAGRQKNRRVDIVMLSQNGSLAEP